MNEYPNEEYEHEGPKCPYCGRQYTADEPHYFDEAGYIEETCDSCEKTFDVDVRVSINWSTSCREETTPPE